MIYRFIKGFITIFLLLFTIFSYSEIRSDLVCNILPSQISKVTELDSNLMKKSKEYIIYNRSLSLDNAFGTYLFIGEYEGKYLVKGINPFDKEFEKIITKKKFDALSNEAQILFKKNNEIGFTLDANLCQHFVMKNEDGMWNKVLRGVSKSGEVRRLRRKLELMIPFAS